MVAITGTILDEEVPRARVALLLKHFSELGDDREPWRVMYPLHEVLLLVTCATIAACDDFKNMAVVRRFALGLVRANKAKGSVKTRRKSAG
jgi:DDE_Tnp_1-associated